MRISFTFEISFGILEKLQDKGAKFKRRVGDKFLYHDGSSFDVVDEDDLPDDLNEESKKRRRSSGWIWKNQEKKKREREKASDFHPGKTEGRQFRQHVYEGSSDSKVAQRAAENHYIMQDVLSDPSLVGASSETEAVAKVASEDPGWAKMSDLVDAYDIDVDADGDIDTGTSTGEASTGLAEAASDAASFDGDVSTADSADLGPTGPSGYSSGDAGSTGGDSGVGGDAGGGDVGGGDL